MKPKDRPQTLVISGRVNDCTLADLHVFFASHDERISSMSELMRMSIESFYEILVRNGMIKVFHTSTREAREYLLRQGLATKRMTEKKSRNLFLDQVNLECSLGQGLKPSPDEIPEDLLRQINQMDVNKMEEELLMNSKEKFCIQPAEEANLRDQLLGAIPSGLANTCEK